MVGRAAGLPESQLVQTEGREDIACGAWTVRGLPSIHGKAIFGVFRLQAIFYRHLFGRLSY
jgi:hypothetical protein